MRNGPYRTGSLVEARAESQEHRLEGVLSAVFVLIAGALAIVSGLVGGSASEGGIGVALLAGGLFMMRGELRTPGLRDRCGSRATSRSR